VIRRLWTLLFLAACAETGANSYTVDTLPSGAIQVINTAASRWADTSGWKLVLEAEHTYPLDSAGALDRPNYPHLLSNGEMVVLNQVPPFIQRYAADFTPLGQVGREGSGPGEYESPAMRTLGDSIVVLDRLRLLLFGADGAYISEHIAPTMTDWMGAHDRAGRLPLLGRYRGNDSDAGIMWWSFTEGRVVDSIIGPVGPPPKMVESCAFVLPYQPEVSLTPTLSGMAWYGVTDVDRFVLTDNGEDTLRIVENSGRPRFDVDSARVNEMFKEGGFLRQMCGADLNRDEVPTRRPAWSWMITDAQDNLWVARPAAYGGSFDVFDSTGVFLGEVASPIRSEENYYWQGDAVMTVEMLEEGGFTLRRYRIGR
jgi:hypothetical protein